jgi:hypothetical protein
MNDNSPEMPVERSQVKYYARERAKAAVVAAAREWRRKYTGAPCDDVSCGGHACNLIRAVDALEELG